MSTVEHQNEQNSHKSEDEVLTKVRCILQPFCLSLDMLKDISARVTKSMLQGLARQTHHRAAVKMLPTFVRATPDGTERGDFLALDLGGTNFRVLYVRVNPDQEPVITTDREIYEISPEIMTGTGKALFDHLAACLGSFLENHKLKEKVLPLGFTFSFPCEQLEIDKSVLIRWTKGYNCSDVERKDVVQLLRDAVRRRGDYEIGSVAMVNDTVGTMMSCGYKNQSCEIGMIIGTGTNACYMEEMGNVKRVEGEAGRMCINTEWGGFGDDRALSDIQTEFDREVDRCSINPGVHIFEKMISGMYLGEIVRLLLVRMCEDNILFKGKVSKQLQQKDAFETKYISEIEEEGCGEKNTKRILSDLDLQWSQSDLKAMHLICDTISSRAAHLCAAALAALANRIRTNRELDHFRTTVGVDGTVYIKHPNFSDKLKTAVQQLAPQCQLDYSVSEDDSGKGAAMVAAVAQRLAGQSRLINDSDEDA